ncbi:MAG: hypothetical protein B6V02_01060 [Thermoprotei archaeon ex4572_64]|nr:MAG: hypothetical protein B6V02_01060 [Thermoprotei archaeon ex4572_64]
MRVEIEITSPSDFIKKVKLPRIPTRPKEHYNFELLDKDLIESIKSFGLLQPVITDRNYIIIDGVKRYIIVKKLIESNLDIPGNVIIIKFLDEDFNEKPISILHLAYIINRFRSGGRDEDFSEELMTYMMDIAFKVWEVFDKDYEKTSRHLGFSLDRVKNFINEYVKVLS